jgi:hypothetical protein
VADFDGFTECCNAIPTAGRARPAAHPQIEFTTIMTVPPDASNRSTASGVRVSSTPNCVKSARMGAMKCSGYATSTF